MKPNDFLKMTKAYADTIAKAATSSVVVGLPQSQGTKAYKNGVSVLQVGAWHEFGTQHIDRRSFLRTPFAIKKKEMNAAIDNQFKTFLIPSADVDKSLGLIGVTALNISRGAFTTMGYGQWPDISQATKTAKGKSQPLINTGLLRGSLTFEVR